VQPATKGSRRSVRGGRFCFGEGKAEKGEEVNQSMRRILLVMAVGLVMAAIVVAMAMPSFAQRGDNPGTTRTGPSETQGPTEPPGTCEVRQGQGQGGGAVVESNRGACR
jgi:hypothetical protein